MLPTRNQYKKWSLPTKWSFWAALIGLLAWSFNAAEIYRALALILLFAYLMATAGAIRLLFLSGERSVPAWEIVVPVLALLVLLYTLYRNVIPYPTGTLYWIPIVCGVWVLAALAFVLARPELARRAGAKLLAEEGLQPERERPRV